MVRWKSHAQMAVSFDEQVLQYCGTPKQSPKGKTGHEDIVIHNTASTIIYESIDAKRGLLNLAENCYIDVKRALLRRSLLLTSHGNFDAVPKRGCEW
ncbi:hypothetical protein AVEN_272202-1 [Araneus ventricosus]|uniref:Uncharacterized protein n=1 Tax=Araneus ventricosus TaxID=182803 RepID=A0A4Y2IZR8_ARAVE|nr:hypothetical protein AVEN_272202-1 [Araneus ventricosus]